MVKRIFKRPARPKPAVLFAIGILAFAFFYSVGNEHIGQSFFISYLVAYQVWLGTTLGCLALALLYTLTGGDWGFAIHRYLTAGLKITPLFVLFFIPLIFGAPHLYPWLHEGEALSPHKKLYFDPTFVLARTGSLFAIWSALAFAWSRLAKWQNLSPHWERLARMQRLSAFGILVYVLTASVAAFDWIMSLTPHWHSTIYGLIVVAGQVLSALALIITIALAHKNDFMTENAQPVKAQHDLGKLLFAFVMIWAYLSFSQFLIIWSGNLPEEVSWYVGRLKTSWLPVSVLVLVLHFALPFTLLLSRAAKRHTGMLAGIGALIFCLRFLEMHWLIAPAFDRNALQLNAVDLGLPLSLGAVWFAGFYLFLEPAVARPVDANA